METIGAFFFLINSPNLIVGFEKREPLEILYPPLRTCGLTEKGVQPIVP